ncbi:MAG: hypothetical protein EOM23_05785, partial [Candidatus Moranbacteria bacterium]|nr:hypothetical protein [Candidatus Moranbacteria bacterium]
MDFFGKKWRKIRIFLFITALLLMVAVFIGKMFQRDFNYQNARTKLQQKILEKESEVILELERLKACYEADADSIRFKLTRYKRKFVEKGYAFFILKGDSLIFWSDNNVPTVFLDYADDDLVMNSGNAWFRSFSISGDELRIVGLYLIKFNYNYQNDYLEN